jgi:hypothetical protein
MVRSETLLVVSLNTPTTECNYRVQDPYKSIIPKQTWLAMVQCYVADYAQIVLAMRCSVYIMFRTIILHGV